jgi:signal transduction histidine kinase/DNA-binding response OmpR family regulator/ligand-binding sensor domain-containing protein
MKTRLIITAFILSVLVSYSSNVKFYDINTIHGISMREIASVCKDKNGFIWASSKAGVLRLTDNSYHIYPLPYETPNIIYTKLIYEKDSLLAFTNNGQIFYYNAVTDRFDLLIDIRKPLNDSHLMLNRIAIDNSGSILIAASTGLYKYQENKLIQLGKEKYADVHDMIWYDETHLLIGAGNGFWLMNTYSLSDRQLFNYNEDNQLKVSKLYYNKADDMLWVGTSSEGLYMFDVANTILTKSPLHSFPKQPINTIEANTDSTMLVGIDGQGIWELSKKGNRILNVYKENADNPLSLNGNGVYDIFVDQHKRVWVCTYSGGLSYFDQGSAEITQITHQINNPNSLNNDNVNKVIEDSRGKIWFATNNGVSSWDVSSDSWHTYYQNEEAHAQVFLSLCEDMDGNIWAGTFSSGVYVIDGQTGREIAHYSSADGYSSLSNNYIFDIFKDSHGDLWLGSPLGQIFHYIESENRFMEYPYQPVYAFAELSHGNLLLACTYGLSLLNKQTGQTRTILDGYLLHDLLIIGDDVWMATSGNGLIRYNLRDNSIDKFTTDAGLPSNYVNSLLREGRYLWLGTESGLCKFDIEEKNVMVFSSLPPFFNVSFNQNSSLKLSNGQLIWGTNSGALMFQPDAVLFSPSEGRIYFQDIIISGRSLRENEFVTIDTPLDELEELSLKYDQNTLTLEFLPIGTTSLYSKFSWQMEGIDEEWTQPANSRAITYASMPGGDYRLKIRMYDSSMRQIINERSLLIHITPPWWNTVWFRLGIFILAGAILVLALRYYINQIRQQHTEDKIRFFTNMAHDIRTSLTLINAPIEELNKEKNLSGEGRYYLNLATEQSDRLSYVANQLLDFQKVDIGKGQVFFVMADVVKIISQRKSMFDATAMKHNISVEFNSNRDTYVTAVDELKIEKVIDNLISNAIKYSHPEGKVQINLSCDPNRWVVEVKDRGLGISDNAQKKLFREFYRGDNVVNSTIVGSGIGLLLVKNYVAMHNGTISLESRENEGSLFRIIIPYKEVSVPSPPLPYDVQQTEIETSDPLAGDETITGNKPGSNQKEYLLIVEDNDDLKEFLQQSLQRKYKIAAAKDGEEAWDMVQKKLPDLIISDVMMPNMDGFELCRLIKSTYETSHIPVILLTALSEKSQQLHGLGLGADDYLTKPFDMTLLNQRIFTIIQNRRIVREKALRLIDEDKSEPIYLNELDDQFVKKAVSVVHTHMDNSQFNKETFASEMNVSTSLLYKKIKSLTDLSPIDFIKSIRLNHALKLIQTGKYTVTEVSELCGFSSVKYFSAAFKAYFGKSPSKL